MTLPLAGIRVVEVATWTFVPAAGAILSDLGADVVKVEPPGGDPQRGLQNMLVFGSDGPNPFVEIPNRGKRSVVLDLGSEMGHEILLRLVATADVFITSYLPSVRQKLRVDVDDLRRVNPDLVYVRGSGWGPSGPMKETAGFDLAAGWASSGLAYRLSPADGSGPPYFQPPAFFDLQGANALAGAVSTALFHRERGGKPAVVDVSLLTVGWWTMAPDIVAAGHAGAIPSMQDRTRQGNPLVNSYRTADNRWIYLVCLQSDRYWAEFCDVIDRRDLLDDPRFVDAPARAEHREQCILELDKAFESRTMAEWQDQLARFSGVWAPVLSPAEILEHPQAQANGYLPNLTTGNGVEFCLPAPPSQFDMVHPAPRSAAPEAGQHSEEILQELGYDWDAIAEFHSASVLG